MIQREKRRAIMKLALPIIGGMASQNVLNLVDTLMIGQIGAEALAAVGLGSFVNFLTSAFVLGLSSGVQALSARRVGEGREHEAAEPLTAGMTLAVAFALPWSLALILAAPYFFPWLNHDAQVVAMGVPYLQSRLAAMAPMGVNFVFRGYWNAVALPGFHLRTLLVMHAANIFLNWLLIYGNWGFPAMGATGGGLATAIATYIGTGYYLILGWRYARERGFCTQWPGRALFSSILRLSVPAGVQQTFFAGGMTTFVSLVGRIGTAELAATQVLLTLVLVGILPGLGFGLAAASFVGQALGQGSVAAAKAWGWDVSRLAMLVVGALSLPAVIAPRLFLSGFLHEAEVLEIAVTPLRLIALMLATETVGFVLMHALQGAGDARRTMWVSISLQWFLFLPAVFLVGPRLRLGLTAVWLVHIVYRQIQSLVFAFLWQRGRWASIRL